MCSRNVAHVIAEYEAARLDDEQGDGDADADSASGDAARASTDRIGLLASVRRRLAR